LEFKDIATVVTSFIGTGIAVAAFVRGELLKKNFIGSRTSKTSGHQSAGLYAPT